MVAPRKCKPSKIIGSISRFAGTLVGTAVITGKRIIRSATPPSKGASVKPVGKTTPAKRGKKAVLKTETKALNAKKKKVVKRKPAASSGRDAASQKKPAQSPEKAQQY